MASTKKDLIYRELAELAGCDTVGLSRLARLSGVDSRTLRQYIRAGKLKAQTTGDNYRIKLEDAAEFFSGADAQLWAAAEGRRKKPSSVKIEFTAEELASETWRKPDPLRFKEDVRAHVGKLEVSNLGRVRNAAARRGVKKHDLIKPRAGAGGYLSVGVSLEPSDAEKLAAKAIGEKPSYRQKNLPVHRLVAAAFLPNPEGKPQVGHKDGNRANNRVPNLSWCTGKENIQHARENGGVGRSQGRPAAKLSEADVKFIRESDLPREELAKQFGIGRRQVFRIRSGGQWRNT